MAEKYNYRIVYSKSSYLKHSVRSYYDLNLPVTFESPNTLDRLYIFLYKCIVLLCKVILKISLFSFPKYKRFQIRILGLYFDTTNLYPDKLEHSNAFHGYYLSYSFIVDNIILFNKFNNIIFHDIHTPPKGSDVYNAKSNEIYISLRLGNDYMSSNLSVCDKLYYEKSIDLAHKLNHGEFDSYCIFSDVPSKVSEYLPREILPKIIIMDEGDIFMNMLSLSNANYVIIPNSTYALWAYLLERDKVKVIISPKKWSIDNNDNIEVLDGYKA
jgi:hypothetical protein